MLIWPSRAYEAKNSTAKPVSPHALQPGPPRRDVHSRSSVCIAIRRCADWTQDGQCNTYAEPNNLKYQAFLGDNGRYWMLNLSISELMTLAVPELGR
jgi:hypothetical protein